MFSKCLAMISACSFVKWTKKSVFNSAHDIVMFIRVLDNNLFESDFFEGLKKYSEFLLNPKRYIGESVSLVRCESLPHDASIDEMHLIEFVRHNTQTERKGENARILSDTN
jgi:hypothetical protein